MTSDHLGSIADASPSYAGSAYGFGLGVSVRLHKGLSALPGTVGDYQWKGAVGTSFFVSPKEKLLAVFMIQEPSQLYHYENLFKVLVMQSIVD